MNRPLAWLDRRNVPSFMAAMALALGSGCAALPAVGMPELSIGPAPKKDVDAKARPSMDEAANAPGKVAVVFHNAEGTPDGGVVMDSSEDLCVSKALVKSKAWSKYGKFTVKLDRRLPNGGRHPLDIELNGRKIDPLKDYHVRAGDRLVVTRDDAIPFEDMFGKMALPFGRRKAEGKYKFR